MTKMSKYCRVSGLVCMALVAFMLAATSTAEKSQHEEIENLNKNLTLFAEVQVADPTDWLSQCAYFFQQREFPLEDERGGPVETYNLRDADSGLCTITLSSAFKDMMWNNSIQSVLEETNLLRAEFGDISEELPELELPSLISNPQTAYDVVQLVKYANENDLQVSVKNSGHNYAGQSTVADSLMINMRKYPKYSAKSLYECDDASTYPASVSAACKLALARNKTALVRVGGGEGNDDIYHSVEYWNNKVPRTKKYDVMGGASGFVGGGGGWLLGGGLGIGATDRSWGVGVDQVLELEMVLPDGRHVKFGPTEWEEKEGLLYPQTTKVTGYCNVNIDHHESKWLWEECEDEPFWEDLWFAVRGAGGGTYGVLLSSTHQLHDFEPFFSVYVNPDSTEAILEQCNSTGVDCEAIKQNVTSAWADFAIDYLWNPSALGVDPEITKKCGYTNPAINLFEGIKGFSTIGTYKHVNIMCRSEAANSNLLEAWQKYVPTSPYLPATGNYTDLIKDVITPCKFITQSIDRYMSDVSTVGYTDGVFCEGKTPRAFLPASKRDLPSEIEKFRETDLSKQNPMGHMNAPEGGATYWPYSWASMIPVAALADAEDRPFWIDFFLRTGGNGHALGGNINISSDGMTPQPIGYREAAVQITLPSWLPGIDGNYTKYEEYISEVQKRVLKHLGVNGTAPGEASFPGFTDPNHQPGWYAGPLKTDWTQACPLEISAEEREELCLSVQETMYGTRNLQRLESIKSEIDPKNLFSRRHGIGNKEVTAYVPPESFQALAPSS